jgi:anthranilate/para-aminobenzoate synthase component I
VLTDGLVASARTLRVPADPLRIARALVGRPGLAVLASRPAAAPRPEDARYSFVASDPVDASDALVPPGATAGDREGSAQPAWIGVIPYEGLRAIERSAWTRDPDDRPPCTLARPAWRRYAAVVRVDHTTGEVVVAGDDERSIASLAERVSDATPTDPVAPPELRLGPTGDAEAHAHLERIREALRLIASGDLYEINLARRIPVTFKGDVLALFTSLLDSAPAPWGFLQDLGETLVIASSPELALSVNGDELRTCPIKGTRPRGRDDEEDVRLARELDADPKEQAELTMAVDVHRNDLGRVAVPGSVRVLGAPRVLGGRTVWSRVAEVVARRLPGASLDDVMRAVLPCGSVTGAPKVRAMEVIARLEPWRRGLYTGAFGYVGRGERLELAMAIRTLQLARSETGAWEGSYFSGGGIVADSVPERELEETRWKAVQLEQLGKLGCATSSGV